MSIDLNPSIAQSWFWWRRRLTDAGSLPFSSIVEKHNLSYPLTIEQYYDLVDVCPYCQGQQIIKYKNSIYLCLCQILDHQNTIQEDAEYVETKIKPATMDDFIIPVGLTNRDKDLLRKAKRITTGFIANPSRWLIYSGVYGTGKTLLARIITTMLQPVCLYISAKDFENKVHLFRKEDELTQLYHVVSVAPVLILDDIGADYGGPLVKTMFSHVIDSRYERYPELPTVVMTNMGIDELTDYAPRAADRLFDKEISVKVRMSGQSFRKLDREARHE